MYWVSHQRNVDLVESSDLKLALIIGESISKCSSIVDFSIHISFVGINALRAIIFTLKVQICLLVQARATSLWSKHILGSYIWL